MTRGATRRQARTEDTEWLIDTHESHERICQRLALTPAALAATLTLEGRKDLATHFWALDSANRKDARRKTTAARKATA